MSKFSSRTVRSAMIHDVPCARALEFSRTVGHTFRLFGRHIRYLHTWIRRCDNTVFQRTLFDILVLNTSIYCDQPCIMAVVPSSRVQDFSFICTTFSPAAGQTMNVIGATTASAASYLIVSFTADNVTILQRFAKIAEIYTWCFTLQSLAFGLILNVTDVTSPPANHLRLLCRICTNVHEMMFSKFETWLCITFK